jgi:hypothetical protein
LNLPPFLGCNSLSCSCAVGLNSPDMVTFDKY